MDVTWSASTSTNQGASEVTDYDVRWSTSRKVTVDGNEEDRCNNSWRNAPDTGDDATDTTTSYTITGLTGETHYCVQVRAVNIHGNGPWSDSVYATTQAAIAPEVPTGLTATAGNRQIRLSWTAPAANGARITSYTITCVSGLTGNHRCDNTDGNNTYTTSGTSYTISGLTNGNTYNFTVAATNSAGTGNTGSTSGVPATRPNRPDPSEIAIAEDYGTLNDGSVNLNVNWVAPEDTSGSSTSGGSAITGYTLQYRASGGNWSFHYFGTTTTSTISGLSIGSRYDVQIRTHTAAGASSWSQKSVTPTGRPAAPSVSSPGSGENQVTANWSGPSNAGESAITSYNVQRCFVSTNRNGTPDDTSDDTYTCGGWTSAGTTVAGTTTLAITNLPCGRRIGVRVQAVNSYGAGPWSDTDRDDATWSAETNACP
jgi:hypothetical protein